MKGSRCVNSKRRTALRVLLAVGLGSIVTGAIGCMRVVRQESPYYVKGPHQAEPPDGFFQPGTKLLVFGENGSYSRVLSISGIAAHIWSQDLLTLEQWRAEQKAAEASEWD